VVHAHAFQHYDATTTLCSSRVIGNVLIAKSSFVGTEVGDVGAEHHAIWCLAIAKVNRLQ
jgi:hypothetical protein